MALTPSTMLPIGTTAPSFSLPDAQSGETVSLGQFEGAQALLVMFICNHCPYVIHIREDFGPLADEFASQGLQVVAINANDLEKYPQDGPENMKALSNELGWAFPFLMDEDQSVAKAYEAACTPDFYLFDADQRLDKRSRGTVDGVLRRRAQHGVVGALDRAPVRHKVVDARSVARCAA